MAVVLALSIKTCDPGRPICLVHDDHVQLPPRVERIFDQLVKLQPDPDYRGCMHKLRLYDWTSFDQTLFIDADCLLMKAQVDAYWSACAGRGFAAPGMIRARGRWLGFEIERLCRRFDCPYLVVLNSGAFYFEKGELGARFFAELRHLYAARRDELAATTAARPASMRTSRSSGSPWGGSGSSRSPTTSAPGLGC